MGDVPIQQVSYRQCIMIYRLCSWGRSHDVVITYPRVRWRPQELPGLGMQAKTSEVPSIRLCARSTATEKAGEVKLSLGVRVYFWFITIISSSRFLYKNKCRSANDRPGGSRKSKWVHAKEWDRKHNVVVLRKGIHFTMGVKIHMQQRHKRQEPHLPQWFKL